MSAPVVEVSAAAGVMWITAAVLFAVAMWADTTPYYERRCSTLREWISFVCAVSSAALIALGFLV